MEQKDEDLMLQYQAGDDKGVAMIFHRYKTRILNFCLRILGNRADAEDVTGDVFLALFDKKYAFTPKAKFSTWLFTIARNRCISRMRKKKNLVNLWFTNRESGKVDQWDIPDTQASSQEALVKREAAVAVKQAISHLPLAQKEALVLREYQKFSYQEISKILNCSLENVKVLIFRAREQLRNDLASFIKEGEK